MVGVLMKGYIDAKKDLLIGRSVCIVCVCVCVCVCVSVHVCERLMQFVLSLGLSIILFASKFSVEFIN